MEELNEEKITVAINKQVWDEFKKYCALNAYKISKKIELLLKEEIEKGPKTKSLIEIFEELVRKQKEDADNQPKLQEELVADSAGNIAADGVAPVATAIGQTANNSNHPKMIGLYKDTPTIEQLIQRRKN